MIVSSNFKLDGSICDRYSANSEFRPLKNSSNWNAPYTFTSDISKSIGFVRPWLAWSVAVVVVLATP